VPWTRQFANGGTARTVALRVRLGLEHLAPTVKTVGADVVAQMGFTGGRLDGSTGSVQRIVRTVHAALGRRLLVLLDSHGMLLL